MNQKRLRFDRKVIVLLIMILLLAPLSTAFAGRTTTLQEGQSVSLTTQFIGSADVRNSTEDITVQESKFDYTSQTKAFDRLPVSWGIEYKHTDLDENLPLELPSHLESYALSAGAKFPVPFVELDHFYLGFDVKPTISTDDGQWEDSAFRIPTRQYLIYKPNERFIFVAGVAVRPDYTRELIPLIGFIYEPTDRLAFNFTSNQPEITYKVSERLTVFSEFEYLNDEYEVTRNFDKGVILKYQRSGAGAGVRFNFTENLEASISAGGIFKQRFEYDDEQGKVVTDDAAYAKVQIKSRF